VWEWQRSLLAARGFEDVFTLDDGTWRRIIGFRRIGEVIEHVDYASGSGFTIRFGDGEFGRTPDAGDDRVKGAVFQVRYRTGPGTRANLPADTVINLKNPDDETQADLAGVLDAVTNPLPITSGVDPEDPAVIKQLAPEAFRAVTFRAVRPEDYAEIAERLPWIQRAGASFRWTGSWLSAFVTPDPLGSFELSLAHRTELENLMDCVRQAGRDVFVSDPRFVNIDLEINICLEPFAYAGQVEARVLEALLGRKGVRPTRGFFDPDNFTFGTPFRRSALEAAIQEVAGVRGVEGMRIRARGITEWRELVELTFNVGHDQVIRLQNDPRLPERGSLRIITRQEQPDATEACQA
jgi:predicted phage baseplate assembly protein